MFTMRVATSAVQRWSCVFSVVLLALVLGAADAYATCYPSYSDGHNVRCYDTEDCGYYHSCVLVQCEASWTEWENGCTNIFAGYSNCIFGGCYNPFWGNCAGCN